MDNNIDNPLENYLCTQFAFFDKYDHRINVKRLKKLFCVDNDLEIVQNLENPKDVIDCILHKYSVKTAIEIVKTIQHYLMFYNCDSLIDWEFENVLDNLLDLQRNPKQYLKLTFLDIKNKLEYFQIKFLSGNPSYTNIRNFLLFNLFFFEAPMALHHYCEIELVQKDFINIEDLIEKKVYLVKKQNQIYFILNRWAHQRFEGQFIYEITSDNMKKLIIKFLTQYSANIRYFLTTRAGRPMSNGNVANTVVNFSRSFFGKSTTLNNVRKLWLNYKTQVADADIDKKMIMYNFK